MHLQPHRVSKSRRAEIRDFLGSRNATTDQIARNFFTGGTMETSRKKASRWLCKERKRKRVHVQGIVLLNATGRPEFVYGKASKEGELEHEVLITEAELLLGGPFQRNVRVGKTTADGFLIRDGNRMYVEIDNESMSEKQMREKWVRYEEIDGFILVICRTKGRLKRLVRSAEKVKAVVLFSRFDWLRMKTVREKWVDWFGKRAEI